MGGDILIKIEITEDANTLLDEIMGNSDCDNYSDVIIAMDEFIMLLMKDNMKLKGILNETN